MEKQLRQLNSVLYFGWCYNYNFKKNLLTLMKLTQLFAR